MNKALAALLIGSTLVAGTPMTALAKDHGDRGNGRAYSQGGGYRGSYRVGGYYPHYSNNRYWIQDYRAYRLPPPRYGYRYYRDDNGDIVMAAIASGIIGLIIGSSINDHQGYPAYGYGYPPPRPYYGYPPPRPYYGYPPPRPYYGY